MRPTFHYRGIRDTCVFSLLCLRYLRCFLGDSRFFKVSISEDFVGKKQHDSVKGCFMVNWSLTATAPRKMIHRWTPLPDRQWCLTRYLLLFTKIPTPDLSDSDSSTCLSQIWKRKWIWKPVSSHLQCTAISRKKINPILRDIWWHLHLGRALSDIKRKTTGGLNHQPSTSTKVPLKK